MSKHADVVIGPGKRANLAERDPASKGGMDKDGAKTLLARQIERLGELQELLWASHTRALLVIFQGLDGAGKDSATKHVMSGVNPQGVEVTSFKQPSAEELDHDFLWRVSKRTPERGRIGIFNRSHYEEVLAVRVHPEWLDKQRLPRSPRIWEERYEDINAFERQLDRNGTKIVKLFLHVSKTEQKKRFLARLDEPHKEWKFDANDVAERAHWDEYMAAYEAALTATSTEWAPWRVVPADHKWVAHTLIASALVDAIESLDLSWPEVSDDERKANAEARRKLEAED
jgi:PPK2 family polyphosphate:nucleotide phosphotransferase